jgi:alpha-L-rhamnosidase
MMKKWLLILVSGLLMQSAWGDVALDALRCEYLENPVGLDVAAPRLSWKMISSTRGQKQTAYQVLVASSQANLDSHVGDLWDSGQVTSDNSIHVAYNGTTLSSGQPCFWKVRVWPALSEVEGEEDGVLSNWSLPATWTMGLLAPEDWTAKWITHPAPERLSHPWIRKTFELTSSVKRAVIHMNTPSYYELYINGQKVSPYVMTPGISKQDKRFLINSYDVTEFLVAGENCLGVWMGPGWYQPKHGNSYNAPILRTQLDIETTSGSIVVGTDSSWRIHESSVSQIGTWGWNDFGGEQVDAREMISDWNQVTLKDSEWLSAREIPAPNVEHSWQACEGAVLGDPIAPIDIFQVESGQWVLDFGKPQTGWLRLQMHDLDAGDKVQIEYSDMNNQGVLAGLAHFTNSIGYQYFNQTDHFISAGAGTETFCSKFNCHSFRYAIISGLARPPVAEDAQAMMIEPEFESAGLFECSNTLYNRIHEATRLTLRTQNPYLALGTGEHREKSAYGDGGANLTEYIYNFKCDANLKKWVRDWNDNQREDGWFGHTAPAFEDHGGGPAWSGQVSELVRRLHLYYGDHDLVVKMVEPLRRYVDFLESKTVDDILRSYSPTGKTAEWMFIGEWIRPLETPGPGFTWDTDEEREFFNNCYRVLLWQQLLSYAEALGQSEEAERCVDRLAVIRARIHEEFYKVEKGEYQFNNQSCLVMALAARIPPPELYTDVLAQLEHEIVVTQKGHLDTGILGTFTLIDLLVKEDRNDLIALIMSQTTYPGWGYILDELGLSTWPESWSGYGSHVILTTAQPGSWFFEGLGGVQPDRVQPGFKHFKLKPGVVNQVDWVNCSYESPYGEIVSSWNNEPGQFRLNVEVPPNSTATVCLPILPGAQKNAQGEIVVTESGVSVADASGVVVVGQQDGRWVLEVESGSYTFEMPLDNVAPEVIAGPDQRVAIQLDTHLDATVWDDGLPSESVTLAWSQVNGPGTVTFGNAAVASTTAVFSETGTYELRLTADDGEVAAADDLVVTVVESRLKNGSFEAGVKTPSDWKFHTVEKTSLRAQNGKSSLVLNASGDQVSQTLAVEEGVTYHLSVWVDASSMTSGTLVFDTNDKYDETCQFILQGANSGWTECTGRFTATGSAVTLRIWAEGAFSGTAYVDSISLIP